MLESHHNSADGSGRRARLVVNICVGFITFMAIYVRNVSLTFRLLYPCMFGACSRSYFSPIAPRIASLLCILTKTASRQRARTASPFGVQERRALAVAPLSRPAAGQAFRCVADRRHLLRPARIYYPRAAPALWACCAHRTQRTELRLRCRRARHLRWR